MARRIAIFSDQHGNCVPYQVSAMAAAIRVAECLPDQFARDLEAGGIA